MTCEATNDELITKTAEHVRRQLEHDGTGHDWWHVERVWKLARRIAAEEGAELPVVELAALLHDVADWKFHGGDETAGPRAARIWLASLGAPAELTEQVTAIVAGVSFKGAGVADVPLELAGLCVQDADRLDALGAIGIARTFAYGGHRGQPLHDPRLSPAAHDSFAAYQSAGGTSINHFYEKLLLLRGRMRTGAGRRIAEERHRFLEEFLRRFHAEWDGRDAGPWESTSSHDLDDPPPTRLP
jgi:uncharacterized protein